VINRGDTLGEMARLYDVSLSTLRDVNRIEGDHIRVGQVLTIPGS
jgi:LysM repeat protein